ncbi:hypothetical protein HLB42_12770 [Deinococcus sp. D7000]|nr:hypothetical protein HLB42_12770 [Deinococcus sp. D7000]
MDGLIMRRIVPLVLLLNSVAAAEPLVSTSDAQNLRGFAFCISDYSLRVGDTLQDDVDRSFAKEQYIILKRKLTAYRVPFAENCGLQDPRPSIFANFSSSNSVGTNNARSYSISFIVFLKSPNISASTAIYLLQNSGVTTNYSLREIQEVQSRNFSDMLDEFAASYAKANP